MTNAQWLAEVQNRIAVDEGLRYTMYLDSADPPNPTIGIGFNLNRSDARQALATCGVAADDIDGVMDGTKALTSGEVDLLFSYSFGPIQSEARASLAPGIYDALSDARRFVLCDLVYNLGDAGWEDFNGTRELLDEAQQTKNAGNDDKAHELFEAAGDHLKNSAWYEQVGDRAMRDVAMIRSSTWVNPTGDGSDAT